MKLRLQVDPDRFEVVYKEVASGSMPELRFYLMVAVSTLIASFGLVSNSTAVVIGAMLVAPLMTPIFGISLALVRGNTRLFRYAARAEVIGVLAAIAMGFVMGFMITAFNPFGEATEEMLARTKPNLYDLFVALLSGFAGAYALLDEKISPALPGVAIATAIVPPLANCGLLLSYGLYQASLGSFLLFLANFLSILLIASLLFFRAGMAQEHGQIKKVDVARRFGLAGFSFLLMVGFLGNALYEIVYERKIYNAVKKELIEEFTDYATTGIDKLVIDESRDKFFILAQIHSPTAVNPNQVSLIEHDLEQALGNPCELIVRVIKTADISAKGSNATVTAQDKEGFFLSGDANPAIVKIRAAEQALREYLSESIGLELYDVSYLMLKKGPTILAMIGGIRPLTDKEVADMQDMVRVKSRDGALRLVVRFTLMDLLSPEGKVNYGWGTMIKPTEADAKVRDKLIAQIESAFSGSDSYLIRNISPSITEKDITFLVELHTTAAYTKKQLVVLQNRLRKLSRKPVNLYVWLNHGPVMTAQGLKTYEYLTDKQFEKYGPEIRLQIRRVLESAR